MPDKKQWFGYEITHGDRYYRGVVKAHRWNIKQKAYVNKLHGNMPSVPYYLGSGYAIREAVLEHGAEAFERKILATFDNFEDADAWERENVVMQDDDPLSYNINSGGKRGFKLGSRTLERMRLAKLGRVYPASHRAAMSKAQQGNTNAAGGEYKRGKEARNYKHGRYCKPDV